jgi:hypothetical protein
MENHGCPTREKGGSSLTLKEEWEETGVEGGGGREVLLNPL